MRMQESSMVITFRGRAIAIAVAIGMGSMATGACGQSAGSSSAPAAGSFRVSPRASGPLHELWENSFAARQERVACLGGYIDHDVVYITRVELLAPSRADSANISAVASIRECSAPKWLGTVHTHIATFHGRPYTIFSAPDRYVMMLWREKWKAPGLFCLLYSDVDANCELGYSVSGHVQYASVKGENIGS
ncbi:MAG TPA: hypothetical protein VN607_14055 [Gemmatimonadaceae bacterium]|nr:hypothetical protein [Gemmatimonadaceae bacterium]